DYCFFLYVERARSVLRSFPTRRSSDLKVMLTLSILQHQWRAPPLKCRPFERRSIPDRLAVLPEIRASPINATDGSGTTKVCRRTDRKSTRLNSSHVKISYAVFCLKKKM